MNPIAIDFTLRLDEGIKFHPGKVGHFYTWHLFRFVHIFLFFLCKYVLNYFFIPLKRIEAITWGNFKRGMAPCHDETFYKWDALCERVTLVHGCFSPFLNCKNGTKSCKVSSVLVDMICKEFIAGIPAKRDRTYSGQPWSYNRHLRKQLFR